MSVNHVPMTAVAREQRLRAACAELDSRLQAGEPARAEDYLTDCDATSAATEFALEVIYVEHVARERRGERPQPEEWYRRFPQWRDPLARLLEVHELAREMDAACPLTLPGHNSWSACVIFSPDSQRLISTSTRAAGGVRIWEAATGRQLSNIPLDGDVYGLDFSPDGRFLALGQNDGRLVVHDCAKNAPTWAIASHKGNILDVAFRADGAWIATAGRDGTATIWDASDGHKVHSVVGLRDVRTVTFRPDSRQFAIGTWPGFVKLYDLIEDQLREVPNRPLASAITRLRWRPDGKQLAVVSREEGVQLWDSQTLALERTLHGNRRAIAFSPDGRRIATAGRDRQVRLWDLTSPHRQPSLRQIFAPRSE